MGARLVVRLATAFFVAALACGPVACRKEKRTVAPGPSGAAPSEATAQGGPLTFTKKGPAVGAKTADVSTMRMKLAIVLETGATGAPKRETTELTSTESQKRVEETLAVEGEARTRVKVTYAEKTDTVTTTVIGAGGRADAAAAPAQKASPLAGKTYVVEAKGAKLLVTLENGAPAPAVEAREVALHYAPLGRPDALLAAMPAAAPAAGEAVPALSKALEEEISRDADGMTVGNGLERFKEARGDIAAFDVSFTLWKDEGPMRFTMSLEGVMLVRADTSAIASMELRGPVSAVARPATATATATPGASTGRGDTGMKILGTGVMEIALSSTPL